MQMIKASVMAATVRRAIQLIPRLTHHNSAQLIKTGTTISSCNCTSPVRQAKRARRLPRY